MIYKLEKISKYGRILGFNIDGFDGSKWWSTNQDFNIRYVKTVEHFFNDLLRVRGYVCLDEVYAKLDIVKTPESVNVGWVYDSNDSDNFIDFDVHYYDLEPSSIDNHNNSIMIIDFNAQDNVIGSILKKESQR